MLGMSYLGMTGAGPRVALIEAAQLIGRAADGGPDDDCRSRCGCTGFVETLPAPDLPGLARHPRPVAEQSKGCRRVANVDGCRSTRAGRRPAVDSEPGVDRAHPHRRVHAL